MAKQTFTTGQVLTAAQMTSLQQTAMGGGAPVTKTASYILVAADAGTVIQMNSASSTTITVNTALFAAGDSVQIQNIGAGVCTITAGTATVTTAGSLALSQWEGGTLYFTSTSASIFFDVVQSGFTSPLTTKGDLYTRTSSADARLPVGTNGYTLVADSAEATGLKWAAPAGGSGLTLISTTTIGSGVSSVTVSNAFSSTYDNYRIIISGGVCSTSNNDFLKLGSTTTGYEQTEWYSTSASTAVASSHFNTGQGFYLAKSSVNSTVGIADILSPYLSKYTSCYAWGQRSVSPFVTTILHATLLNTTSYTDFTLTPDAGTLTGGTIKVYGYANS